MKTFIKKTGLALASKFNNNLLTGIAVGVMAVGGITVGAAAISQETDPVSVRITENQDVSGEKLFRDGIKSAAVLPDTSNDDNVPTTAWVNNKMTQASTASLAGLVDTDKDGILDAVDNCKNDENPNQKDDDGDGIGNMCDSDFDKNPGNLEAARVKQFVHNGENYSLFYRDREDLDWTAANQKCLDLGNEYRLPTKPELQTIYEKREQIFGLATTKANGVCDIRDNSYDETAKKWPGCAGTKTAGTLNEGFYWFWTWSSTNRWTSGGDSYWDRHFSRESERFNVKTHHSSSNRVLCVRKL